MSDRPPRRGGGPRGGGNRGDRGDGGGRGGRGGRGGGDRGGGDRGGRGGGDRGGGDRGGRGDFPPRGGGNRGDYVPRGRGDGGGRGGPRGGRGDFVPRGRGDFGRGGGRGGRGGGRGGRVEDPNDHTAYPGNGQKEPEPTVVQAENAFFMDKAMGQLTLSGKSSKADLAEFFPPRPAYGTAGQPISVWTNSFKINVNTESFWSYTLDVAEIGRKDAKTADIKGRKLHLVIEELLSVLRSQNKNVLGIATEYKSKIVTTHQLDLKENPLRVELKVDGETDTTDKFDITINGPTEARIKDMLNYLQSQERGPDALVFPRFPEVLDALNVVLGTTPRSQLDRISAIGNARFFPVAGHPSALEATLGYNRALLAGRGFFQSTRYGTGRLLLNVNPTHGVFRAHGKLVDIYKQHDAQLGNYATLKNLDKTLSKARVMAQFKAPNGKAYTKAKSIFGLVSKSHRYSGKDKKPKWKGKGQYAGPKDIEFWLEDRETGAGKYISVYDHYRTKYDQTPGDWPLVNLGNADKPVFLVAEVIEVLPGQSMKTKLTGDETTDMLNSACKRPHPNALAIQQHGRSVLGLDSPFLEKFKIKVGPELLAVMARELMAPKVVYAKGQGDTKVANNGSWNLASVKFYKPKPATTWAAVQVNTGHEQEEADWVPAFRQEIEKTGVKMPAKQRADAIVSRVNQLPGIFEKHANSSVIIFCFYKREDKSGDFYQQIKYLGDCVYGVQTICIIHSKFIKFNKFEGEVKPDSQYAANIALKLNLKLGGVNHKLSQDLELIKDGKTMIVGYDVTHPTNMAPKKSDAAPSLVGIVSSIDADLAQWPSETWEQSSKQEMLSGKLVEAFTNRLARWRKGNAKYPENIIIYRDGVSEGQFSQVLNIELPMIRDACRKSYANATAPKITLIISVKRHQTRFYPTQVREPFKGKPANPNIKPGTVVDRGVTQARYWDFYLAAHEALQGTTRPAHYTVLLDEVFRAKYKERAADQLQKMTHELCYLFGRATKAVSICPPAYYADIVCERARLHRPQFFGDEQSDVSGTSQGTGTGVHARIVDTMYYL